MSGAQAALQPSHTESACPQDQGQEARGPRPTAHGHPLTQFLSVHTRLCAFVPARSPGGLPQGELCDPAAFPGMAGGSLFYPPTTGRVSPLLPSHAPDTSELLVFTGSAHPRTPPRHGHSCARLYCSRPHEAAIHTDSDARSGHLFPLCTPRECATVEPRVNDCSECLSPRGSSRTRNVLADLAKLLLT